MLKTRPTCSCYSKNFRENQAKDESSKVSFCKKKVLMSGKSGDSRSQGDEAGTLFGMVSNSNMSGNKCKTGSGKVKVQGAFGFQPPNKPAAPRL